MADLSHAQASREGRAASSARLPSSVTVHHFRFATPALVAGANQQRTELRASSINGALRFWWRAARAPRLIGEHLSKLRGAEGTLFGAAGRDDGTTAQGRFFLAVANDATREQTLDFNGSGLSDYAGPAKRRSGRTGEFELDLATKSSATVAELTELALAFRLFCSLGGIGLMARRGFGSPDDLDGPRDHNGFLAALRTDLRHVRSVPAPREAEVPSFPTFSQASRVLFRRFPAGTAGLAALQAHASDVANFAAGSAAMRFNRADLVFSDQYIKQRGSTEPDSRRMPSPLHVHVATLDDATLVVCAFMPTAAKNPGLDAVYPQGPRAGARIDAFFASHPQYEEI